MKYLDTFHRAERQETTLDPEYVSRVLHFPTPKRYARIEAATSAQLLEEDRLATKLTEHPASAELAKAMNPETVAAQQREILELKNQNAIMAGALKDLAYGAVMMIAVTDGATRNYVREVYSIAMAAVGGSRG
jgi:ADP-ribose pyrophosphatase YjhB (NUDIX family)